VIVVGPSGSQIGFPSPGGVAGTWSSDGHLKQVPVFGTNAAFDARSHLFTVDSFLTERDDTYAIVRKTALPEPGVAVVADGLGGAYVLGASGTMYFYDASGTLQRQFPIDGVVIANASRIRLDFDGACTLAYHDPGTLLAGGVSIARFDVCAVQPLSSFGDGKPYDSFRLMQDGFVAARGSTLLFHDGQSRLVQSRTLPVATVGGTIPALAFGAELGSIWIAVDTHAENRRLSDGVLLATLPGGPPVVGIAVNGEQRPSLLDRIGRRRSTRH